MVHDLCCTFAGGISIRCLICRYRNCGARFTEPVGEDELQLAQGTALASVLLSLESSSRASARWRGRDYSRRRISPEEIIKRIEQSL